MPYLFWTLHLIPWFDPVLEVRSVKIDSQERYFNFSKAYKQTRIRTFEQIQVEDTDGLLGHLKDIERSQAKKMSQKNKLKAKNTHKN